MEYQLSHVSSYLIDDKMLVQNSLVSIKVQTEKVRHTETGRCIVFLDLCLSHKRQLEPFLAREEVGQRLKLDP